MPERYLTVSHTEAAGNGKILQKRDEGADKIYGKRIHESRAFMAEI